MAISNKIARRLLLIFLRPAMGSYFLVSISVMSGLYFNKSIVILFSTNQLINLSTIYSTVTLFAKLRGLSTSNPFATPI